MATTRFGALTKLPRRWAVLFIVIAAAYFLVVGGQAWFIGSIRDTWPRMRGEIDSSLGASVRERFDRRVRDISAVASELAASDALRALLTASDEDPARMEGARALLRFDLSPEYDVECFSAAGVLRFSIGRRLPPPKQEDRGRWHLADGGVNTLLICERTTPDAGLLRIAVPFSVSVPVNTRFFSGGGIKEELEKEIGVSFDIETDLRSPSRLDGRLLAAPLVAGRDTLALALLPRTSPAAHTEKVVAEFARARSFLLAILFACLLLLTRRLRAHVRPESFRAALTLAVIWAVRLAMLALGVGQGLLPDAVLHPAGFASSLGFGLASSPGELFLTLLAIIASGTAVYRAVRTVRATQPGSIGAARLQIILPFLLLPLLLRGLAASMRSFVLDSSFNYDDIVPFTGEPLIVFMYANVYLLAAACLIGIAVLHHIARRAAGRSAATTTGRVALAAGASAVSLIAFAVLTSEYLVPLWLYAAAAGVFLAGVLLRPGGRTLFGTVARVSALWIGATLVSAFLLGMFMREKRAQNIGAIGNELARPVDGWTKLLCEEALRRIATDTIPEPRAFSTSGASDYNMCFALWARSALSAQPNNAAILAFDSLRAPLSRFAVGVDPKVLSDGSILEQLVAAPGRAVIIEVRSTIRRRPYYGGLTEARTQSGRRRWIAVLVEGLDPMQVSRNEIDLLRSTPRRSGLAPEDRFVSRLFRRGRMIECSDPARIGATLPDSVWRSPPTGTEGFWSAVDEEGASTPAYLVRYGRRGASILALSAGDSDPLFSVFRVLRLCWLFLLFSLIGGTLFLRASAFRPLYAVPFSRIVQFSLLSVAAIPVVLVWFTARSYVMDNARRSAERQLSERLDAAEQRLAASLDSLRAESVHRTITDSLCFEIADASQSVLNVFVGHDLHATSKPELYHTALLNTRIHPAAYVDIVLRGAAFAVTEERIGDFPYAVGYRALRDRGGRTLAVLSIPTLFESGRAEEQYIRASAIIFIGTAAIALIVVLLSGALSRQISRPLRQLIAATNTIASGDLSRRVSVRGSAEVRELGASFNSMTEQLRVSREELSAAERELAWKEMAKQVAHEIRNPLTPIKLAAQHLQRAAQDGAERLRETVLAMTRTIIEQIDTLARISEEFAHFARLPRRSLADVDVAEVLKEAMDLHRPHENIRFTLRTSKAVFPVRADRQELARAFNNILRNAVQAIQGNGAVTAEVSEADGAITITIRDTGVGIDPDLLPHIFEPNFSTKTEGMGLGLAIVKKIIDDLEGTIEIVSTPGDGSTVRMTLPAGGREKYEG